MKTDRQLISIALKMAADDPNAVIVFVLPSLIKARQFFDVALISYERADGLFKHQALEVVFPSGGRITFKQLDGDSLPYWGGFQYSHAFVPRYIGSQYEDLVRSKLRYPVSRTPKEPSGIYRPHWVERAIKYEDIEQGN